MTVSGSTDGGLLRMIAQALAVALLLLVVALGAAVIVVPRLADAIPLTVLTSSMEPGLPPGTLLIVRPVDPGDVRVGDVVTYQIRPNVPGVITHRVVSINVAADGSRTFVFKGDNNSVSDKDAVVEAQVMGRLWYSVPLIGFVNTSTGGSNRAWLIPAAASALLLYAAWTIVREIVAVRRAKRRAESESESESVSDAVGRPFDGDDVARRRRARSRGSSINSATAANTSIPARFSPASSRASARGG